MRRGRQPPHRCWSLHPPHRRKSRCNHHRRWRPPLLILTRPIQPSPFRQRMLHRLLGARKTCGVSGDGAFSECRRTRQSARRTERDATKEKNSFCWLHRLDGENVAHAIAAKVWESSESDPKIEIVVDMEKLAVEVTERESSRPSKRCARTRSLTASRQVSAREHVAEVHPRVA